MNSQRVIAYMAILFMLPSIGIAQRIFGAGGFQLDNNTSPIHTILLQAPTSLSQSYILTLPETPPLSNVSILVGDVTGQLFWASGIPLPPLPSGNIWVGNASNVPTPYAPTGPGKILTLDITNTPVWSNTIPSNTTVSISQLTTGTLQPAVTFSVGPGSAIVPAGGTVTANSLSGSGTGKYSGAIPIPVNAQNLIVSFAGISAASTVLVTIHDVGLPGVLPYVENITPGAGFKVTFSAIYPTTTGVLSYTIITP